MTSGIILEKSCIRFQERAEGMSAFVVLEEIYHMVNVSQKYAMQCNVVRMQITNSKYSTN